MHLIDSTQQMSEFVDPIRLAGFDSSADVFSLDGRVIRCFRQGKGELSRQVFQTCAHYRLFQHGIVETRELSQLSWNGAAYDLILEHERIAFISYPHEWSPTMLQDAAILHVDLFMKLAPLGLTIKDWHPYNILFKGPCPIFVDFASLVPFNHLPSEEYLNPPSPPHRLALFWDINAVYLYEMYSRMCVPYFLLPLYLMERGQHQQARLRLIETALNARDDILGEDEVFSRGSRERRKYRVKGWAKKLALVQAGHQKSAFFRLLRREIRSRTVELSASSYSEYYLAKNEAFSYTPSDEWTGKQWAVFDALSSYQPKTVLDLACNTGWFSILAAKMGCDVVAVDIDEACVDILYRRAKQEALSILPLVIDLLHFPDDMMPLPHMVKYNSTDDSKESSLFPAASKRLRCDMVLALAIVHHLTLGHGLSFDEVAELLARFTKCCLVVEFVAMDDTLIADNPGFFPSLCRNRSSFDGYTLEGFISALSHLFRVTEIRPSSSGSRTVLVCERQQDRSGLL